MDDLLNPGGPRMQLAAQRPQTVATAAPAPVKDVWTESQLKEFRDAPHEPNGPIKYFDEHHQAKAQKEEAQKIAAARANGVMNPVAPDGNAAEDGEWRSMYTPTEEQMKKGAETAGRLGRAAKEWAETNPVIPVSHREGRRTITDEDVENHQGNDYTSLINGDDDAAAPRVSNYDDLIKLMVELRKADNNYEKGAKARNMVASIGDAISALSSMYQTTKGAPLTYNHDKSMNTEVTARDDRERKLRQARDADILNTYYKAMKLKSDEETAKKAAAYQSWKMTHDEGQAKEQARHNRAMEELYGTKENNNKEAKAAEQKRKDSATEVDNEVKTKKADAYVEAQKNKGSSGKSGGSSKSSKKGGSKSKNNTPPGVLKKQQQNQRPSQRNK